MRAWTRSLVTLAVATLPLLAAPARVHAHAEGVKPAGCPADGYLYAVPVSWRMNPVFTCPNSSYQTNGVALAVYAESGGAGPDAAGNARLEILFDTQKIGNQAGTWTYHTLVLGKQRWYEESGVILSTEVWDNYSEAITYRKGNTFKVMMLINKRLDHQSIRVDTKIAAQILHSVLLS